MLAVLPFRGSVTQGKRRRKEHKRRKQEEQIQKRTHATEKNKLKRKTDPPENLCFKTAVDFKGYATAIGQQVFAYVGKN